MTSQPNYPYPTLDLGPLEPLLEDSAVMEIMVNNYETIYVERHGRIEKVDAQFRSEDHLLSIIRMILEPMGLRADESSPIVDGRLPDGSRVHVVLYPIAINGHNLTIRKFLVNPLTIDELIGYQSLTPEIADFLKACVIGRMNILVSGGTGSGKTTILNTLANFIPDDERIIILEDSASLQLKQPHCIILETRPANIEGRGEVNLRQLVQSAMKMHADRIVINEVNSGEVADILEAMNTGFDGSMFAIHANSPRDAFTRLEVMATMSGLSLTLLAIRERIATGIDVVVQQMRLPDGRRKIVSVSEVTGMQGDMIVVRDIFRFVQTGRGDEGISGYFAPTGQIPSFMNRLADMGINLPMQMFTAPYGTPPVPPVPPEPPVPPVPPVPPIPPQK
ncbi:MAG: CpaF family protein [Anaerolineaceae bacterium]|nr:CpaF family protein [Anaerolineaceae bacterium]